MLRSTILRRTLLIGLPVALLAYLFAYYSIPSRLEPSNAPKSSYGLVEIPMDHQEFQEDGVESVVSGFYSVGVQH